MNKKMVFLVVALVLLSVFLAQNYRSTELRFLFWSFKTSTALLVLIFLAAGAGIGWFLSCLRKGGGE